MKQDHYSAQETAMQFSKVTAIIRPERLEEVERALKSHNVPGVSVTKVKGFGEYANFYKSDWTCTHVRLEIFTSARDSQVIADSILAAAHTGLEGDGIVAVMPVESVYHIRTRQKCDYDVCR